MTMQSPVNGLTPAGERILESASELFYNQGLHAVGVELIADHAGTTKKTLYDRFGSKDVLIATYLHRRAERWQEFLQRYLNDHSEPPGTAHVLRMFDGLAAWMRIHTRGCAFVNARAELTDENHPAMQVIAAEKRWIRSQYEQLADDAGFADPTSLAGQLILLHEGAIVDHTVSGNEAAIATAKEAAATLMAAAPTRTRTTDGGTSTTSDVPLP